MTSPLKGIENILKALPQFGRQPFAMASVTDHELGVNPYLDTVYRMATRQGEKAIPVGVVSKNYRLIDHQSLLTTIQQALLTNDIDMDQVQVMGSWTVHGERAHFSFLLPDNAQFVHVVNGEGDQMRFRIEIFNSVEGSFRLMAVAGWLRFVCTNGLIVGNAVMDLRRQHRQQLQIEDIGRLLNQSIKNVDRDKNTFALWKARHIDPRSLIPWIDDDVREQWGVKAAVRVFGIARSGHDVIPIGDMKRVPSEIDTKNGGEIAGICGPVKDVFGIGQVLSWVAGQRAETAEDLEWRSNVPELIDKLLNRSSGTQSHDLLSV